MILDNVPEKARAVIIDAGEEMQVKQTNVLVGWNQPQQPELVRWIQEALPIVTELSQLIGISIPKEGDNHPLLLLSIKNQKENVFRCQLSSQENPPNSPPESMLRLDEKIREQGGLSHFIKTYMKVANATYRITFSVTGAYTPLLPVNPPTDAEKLITGLAPSKSALEHIGFRFEESYSGIEEIYITFAHKNNTYHVVVHAKGPLDVNDKNDLPYVQTTIDTLVPLIFQGEAR